MFECLISFSFMCRWQHSAFCYSKKEGEVRMDKWIWRGVRSIENNLATQLILTRTEAGPPIYLYLSVTNRVVSFVLIQEKRNGWIVGLLRKQCIQRHLGKVSKNWDTGVSGLDYCKETQTIIPRASCIGQNQISNPPNLEKFEFSW